MDKEKTKKLQGHACVIIFSYQCTHGHVWIGVFGVTNVGPPKKTLRMHGGCLGSCVGAHEPSLGCGLSRTLHAPNPTTGIFEKENSNPSEKKAIEFSTLAAV